MVNSTVSLDCFIDANKYKDCQTEEERDMVIREDMSEGGNLNPILNVLSAFRQDDPYYYDLCLNYPNKYSPQEVKDNFKRYGYSVGESVGDLYDTIEHLSECKVDSTRDLDDIGKDIGKCIEVHSNSMEEPIKTYNSECEDVIRVYYNDESDKYYPVKCRDKKERKVGKCHRKPFKINVHTNPDVKVLWKIDGELDLTKSVCQAYISCTVKEDNWYERCSELEEFLEREKRRPSCTSKDEEEKRLGQWISHQNQNYKKFQEAMKDPEKRKKWEQMIEKYKEYFKSYDEIWYENYKNLIEFIKNNERKPSFYTKKNNEEKKLGLWVRTQISNYKKNQKSMKDEDKRKKWDELLENYKEYIKSNDELWYENYNKLIEFFENNERKPTEISKDSIEKKIAKWVSGQTQNYKKNQQSMKDEDKRKKWEELLEKYNEYFKSSDEKIWDENYIQLVDFLERNKKRPSHESKNQEENRRKI